MNKLILFSFLFLVCVACSKTKPEVQDNVEEQYTMFLTQYYSIKMENGRAIRDTLKDCFSCNQAVIKNQSGKELERIFL